MIKIYEQDLSEDISADDYQEWYKNSYLENGVRIGHLSDEPKWHYYDPNEPVTNAPMHTHRIKTPLPIMPAITQTEDGISAKVEFEVETIPIPEKYRAFMQNLTRQEIDIHRTGHNPELVIIHPKTAAEINEFQQCPVTELTNGLLKIKGLKVFRSEDIAEWEVMVK